jgi:hypothetical protein
MGSGLAMLHFWGLGVAVVMEAVAVASGPPHPPFGHLLPAGEKRKCGASGGLPRWGEEGVWGWLRGSPSGEKVRQGASGGLPLLPSGEKCRVKRGDEGAVRRRGSLR